MTWPFTFPSPPDDWHRIYEGAKGERAIRGRENAEVVRGSYSSSGKLCEWKRDLRGSLTNLAALEESILMMKSN